MINIDRGWHTASILVEMLSQTWPEWTFNNRHTHYYAWEVCLWLSCGWTPREKELKISFSLFRGLCAKPFTSRKVVCQLVRVPYIIWKVLLSFFYRFWSFFHIYLREWPQKYLKVLYANTGSIFQPFCNFSHTALLLASLRQAPQITEGY